MRILVWLCMSIVGTQLSFGSCEQKIKDFYAQYMTNSEHNWKANEALCDSILATGVVEKLQAGIEEPDADYIIRAQDVCDYGIKSLIVEPLSENDWYMVRYKWDDESEYIEIPLKAVISDGRLKILYITPLRFGIRYGDALLNE